MQTILDIGAAAWGRSSRGAAHLAATLWIGVDQRLKPKLGLRTRVLVKISVVRARGTASTTGPSSRVPRWPYGKRSIVSGISVSIMQFLWRFACDQTGRWNLLAGDAHQYGQRFVEVAQRRREAPDASAGRQ